MAKTRAPLLRSGRGSTAAPQRTPSVSQPGGDHGKRSDGGKTSDSSASGRYGPARTVRGRDRSSDAVQPRPDGWADDPPGFLDHRASSSVTGRTRRCGATL